MKKRILIVLMFAVLILAAPLTVSAQTESAGSLDELLSILARNNGTAEITISKTIAVDRDIDLKGNTIIAKTSFPFNITGGSASIKNGTINGGGIKVTAPSDDPAGIISNVKISSPSEQGILVWGTAKGISSCTITSPSSEGIYLYGGKVKGSINGNTIRNGKYIGIYLMSNSGCGDISNNKISGCADHAIRLVGNSNASSNNGCYAGDIVNNTITSCKGHGISIYHGSHCGKISYNTLKDIGGTHEGTVGDFGIIVNSGCRYKSYATEITHNTLDRVSYAGIALFAGPFNSSSKKWQDNAYVTGDIAYNTINHSGSYNKKINWLKGSAGSKHPCEGSIYIDSHSKLNGSIHHNTITEPYDNGICVLAYASVKDIRNNKISDAHNAGISINNNSKVRGNISSNTINDPLVYGILINNKSKVTGKGKAITKNTIKNPGQNGIAVMQGAKVTTISSNTIKKAKLYGIICANSKASVDNLTSNTISMNNAKTGMGVLSNTNAVIVNIKKNSVTGKFCRGIRVKGPTAKIKITSNKVVTANPSSIKSICISIEGCKNKTITVTGNKITGNNTGSGIYISTSAGVVKNNTIKKSTTPVGTGGGSYKVRT